MEEGLKCPSARATQECCLSSGFRAMYSYEESILLESRRCVFRHIAMRGTIESPGPGWGV